MKRIRLTHKQTRLWESSSEPDSRPFQRAKIAEARAIANETGETVEIVSHDGIVMEAVTPE